MKSLFIVNAYNGCHVDFREIFDGVMQEFVKCDLILKEDKKSVLENLGANVEEILTDSEGNTFIKFSYTSLVEGVEETRKYLVIIY